jgi:hypothetical protein
MKNAAKPLFEPDRAIGPERNEPEETQRNDHPYHPHAPVRANCRSRSSTTPVLGFSRISLLLRQLIHFLEVAPVWGSAH